MTATDCLNDTSATGILRALPESALLAAMRDHFAVDVNGIGTMPRSQQLRMVDACRFLNNNLPLETTTESVAA
jgi:hypothetical protein